MRNCLMIRILRLIQVVVVIATACSLVAILTTTADANVQSATVTPVPAEVSCAASYTIAFHVGANGALSAGVDTINTTFPIGTTLPSVISKTLVTINGIEPQVELTVSGQTITLVTPVDVLDNGSISVSIEQAANIVNPKIANNNYKVQIFTSREPIPVGSNAYTITPYFSIYPIAGPRNGPIAVTGNGWAPNQSIEIRGALNSNGTASVDGTFSLSASPTNSGIVTCTDGSGWGSPNSGAGNTWNMSEPTFKLTPMVQITPTSGNRGTCVTIRGYDFTTGSSIPVNCITMAGVACGPATSIVLQTLDPYGTLDDFVTTLTVPSNITCGVLEVSGTDANGETGTTTFTIEPLSLTISPPNGPTGTLVTISGSSFAAGDIIAPGGITLGGIAWNTQAIQIDSHGNWTASLIIPASAPVGSNTVAVTTSLSSILTIPFVVSAISGDQPAIPAEMLAPAPVLISTPTPTSTLTATPTTTLTATPTMTPIPTPTTTLTPAPVPIPSPSPTMTPTPTPTPTKIAASIASSKPPEDRGFSLTNKPSTEPGVIFFNFGLALITILVFYLAATIFNSTVRDNYKIIQGWLGRGSTRLRFIRSFASGIASGPRHVIKPKVRVYLWGAFVILMCAAIYLFLEPYFINALRGLQLFIALALGITIAMLGYEGTQILVSVRRFHVPAAIKIYPIAIVIAGIFVFVSRKIDFHPGLIYGFVGAYAALSISKRLDKRQQAITIALGILAILAISVVAFFLSELVKNDWGGKSFGKMLVEDTLVAAYCIGLEGLLFAIALPVTFTDGKKIKDWNFSVWLACAGTVVFTFYEIIINDKKFTEAVKSINVQMMFVLMGLSLLLSGVVWLFFRVRREFQPEETITEQPHLSPERVYKPDDNLRGWGTAKQTSALSKEMIVEQSLMLPDMVYKQDKNTPTQETKEQTSVLSEEESKTT